MKTAWTGLFTAAVLMAALLLPATASAQVPPPDYLPYQGYLTDAAGIAVDGVVNLTFRIYEGGNDQVPIWEETHLGVQVTAGCFMVPLAQNQSVVDAVIEGQTRYLGIQINQDPEAQPRQQIGSVPYAMLAIDSTMLGGVPADQFLTEVEINNLIENIGGGEGGLNEAQINALIDARNYLNEAEILALILANAGGEEGGLNEAQVNALIDARNYVNGDAVNVLIDARNYVNEDAVNVLIDARNYLDEAAIIVLINQLIDARNFVTIEQHDADIANLQNVINEQGDVINNLQEQLENIVQDVENVQNVVNNLNLNGGNVGYILGVSAQVSNGGMSFNGQSGLGAADEMCRATFADDPTAHLCATNEVQWSLAAGTYNENGNFSNVDTWSLGNTSAGSWAKTCHNFLYPTAHIGTGTILRANLTYQPHQLQGRAFNLVEGVACGTQHPVLCCR